MSNMQTVIVVGASGYLGSCCSLFFEKKGFKVIGVSRSKIGEGWRKWGEGCLEGADIIINLAGKSVACRWNAKIKQELVDSRVKVSDQVVKWISDMPESERPSVYLCASGIGIIDANGEVGAERSGSNGADFLANLCGEWEASAMAAEAYGVRTVCLRFGAVLGKNSDAWKKLSMPYKFFVGGALGDKDAYFSWIHEQDAVAGVLHCIELEDARGGVNFVGEQITHGEVARAIGRAMNRPSVMPVPAFGIRLLLGEFADGLLASVKVKNSLLDKTNYDWQYKSFDKALSELTG